jgi:hypothetical protein
MFWVSEVPDDAESLRDRAISLISNIKPHSKPLGAAENIGSSFHIDSIAKLSSRFLLVFSSILKCREVSPQVLPTRFKALTIQPYKTSFAKDGSIY